MDLALVVAENRNGDAALPRYASVGISDGEVRLIVLQAILEVCGHRESTPYGVHVRSTHVHAVIGGEGKAGTHAF